MDHYARAHSRHVAGTEIPMILSAHPGIIAEQNLQGKLYPTKIYKLAKQTRKGGAARCVP